MPHNVLILSVAETGGKGGTDQAVQGDKIKTPSAGSGEMFVANQITLALLILKADCDTEFAKK